VKKMFLKEAENFLLHLGHSKKEAKEKLEPIARFWETHVKPEVEGF
jgi:hypothetical protein